MDKFEKNTYWKILQNKDSHELIFISPSATGASPLSRKDIQQYDEVGFLRDANDAASFLEFKEMDMRPDAIAFLKCEHDVNERLAGGASFDREILSKLIADMRKDTGRTCFGTCRSYEKEKACETCFLNKQQTWILCATAKCLHISSEKRL